MKNDQVIICRVAYCEACHQAKRPQLGQQFITIGSRKEVHLHRVQNTVSFGFVPTLFIVQKADKKNMHYTRICCMDGCGVKIAKEPNDKGKYPMEYLNETGGMMPLLQWNSMIINTDLGYYLGK